MRTDNKPGNTSMADELSDDDKNRSLADEIIWTIRRLRLLFHYWTISVAMVPPNPSETADDRISSRAFALLLIAALTFAVRGDLGAAPAKVSFAALAAGLAAILSIALNIASKTFQVTVTDRTLIKAYTSIIVVMVLYVVFQTVFEGLGFNWYRILIQETGPIFGPAVLATFVTFGFLLLKANYIDHHSIRFLPAVHALGITICSGLIVWAISHASNDFFGWIISLLSHR